MTTVTLIYSAPPQPSSDSDGGSTAPSPPPSDGGSTAPISRCSGAPRPLNTQTKRKITANLPPRKRTKQLSEDDPWVPELNLTLKEKFALESSN